MHRVSARLAVRCDETLLQMMTTAIHGLPILPAAVADEKGCAVVVQRAPGPAWLERLLRPLCTEMGCSAGFSCRPLTGSQLRSAVVPHSLSLAWRLGAAAAAALHEKRDAAAAIAAAGGGRVLFRGAMLGSACGVCLALGRPVCVK
jgi:DUF917 family protein